MRDKGGHCNIITPAIERASEQMIVCTVYCNHPVAFRTIQNTIRSDARLRDTIRSYSDECPSLKNGVLDILVLDTCSVQKWQRPLDKWQSKCGRIIALISPDGDRTQQIQILSLGAMGIISFADDQIKQLPKAIHAAVQGKRWINRHVLDEYVNSTRHLLQYFLSPHNQLTPRESEIVGLLQRGFSNKQLANSLGISERTIKFHVSNLLKKYQIGTRRSFMEDSSIVVLGRSGINDQRQ